MLPDALVDRIAAGEVVERPASVLKELVENALDAEATRIEIAIGDGGIRWISVADDGIGLSRPQAELAFRRHATSKLRTADDLARVSTLGFRGEALPSIASVARVRMRTRRAEDAVGTELEGEGRGIERVRECACPAGTRVEVAELFGHVPARRKFLKAPQTEAGHIVRWLERIALVRPDVHFALERDGRPALLFAPTADLRERIAAVLPASVGDRLVGVEISRGDLSVRGWVSLTDVRRGTTADIHVMVNARPVRDRLLLHAVRDAYRDALPPGRHPAAVLYLDVPLGEVDVNVHPAKWEVRFRDPRAITGAVREAIVASLGLRREAYPNPAAGAPARHVDRVADASAGEVDAESLFRLPPAPLRPTGTVGAGTSGGAAPFAFADLRYLGQAFGAYLVCERPGELVLLDQHAAHERVLFERMRQTVLAGKLESQPLLLPVKVELPRSAADALLASAELLARAGFELAEGDTSVRGQARVSVHAVPALLVDRPGTDWRALLEETATSLADPAAQETRDGVERALHGTLATAACHASRRKGDRLDPREVDELLRALDEIVWFPNCPHGRPILAALPEGELERRFLRR